MSLLIGLGLVLCVCLGEAVQPTSHGDLRMALAALGAVAVSVPGMALFQAWYLSRHGDPTKDPEAWGNRVERMIHWNGLVWLGASLAIIVGVRWPTVVREEWGLDRWPLIDELVVILPSLLALLAAWGIQTWFFPMVGRSLEGAGASWESLPRRYPDNWSGLRFRVRYILPAVLMPLLLGVLLKDAVTLSGGQAWLGLALAVTCLLLVFYPQIVVAIWPTRPLPDSELKSALVEFLKTEQAGVREIRVLQTDGCFLAALTLGLCPGTRVILLTDTLLNEFSNAAIAAVVRHEAAHIRRHHFAKRLLLLVVPVVLLVALVSGAGNLAGDELGFLRGFWWSPVDSYPAVLTLLVLVLAYASYLVLVVGPWLRQMELEADTMAGGQVPALRAGLQEALIRFAAWHPARWDRDGWTHPSFARRLAGVDAQRLASQGLHL